MLITIRELRNARQQQILIPNASTSPVRHSGLVILPWNANPVPSRTAAFRRAPNARSSICRPFDIALGEFLTQSHIFLAHFLGHLDLFMDVVQILCGIACGIVEPPSQVTDKTVALGIELGPLDQSEDVAWR